MDAMTTTAFDLPFLDPEPLAPLLLRSLLRLLLVGLEDAQPAALGLGVQPGQRLAQGQGLVLVKAEALGDHGCPQGQDWRSVDRDGSGHGASTQPGLLPAVTASRPRH